jgi:hypothetical protein
MNSVSGQLTYFGLYGKKLDFSWFRDATMTVAAVFVQKYIFNKCFYFKQFWSEGGGGGGAGRVTISLHAILTTGFQCTKKSNALLKKSTQKYTPFF